MALKNRVKKEIAESVVSEIKNKVGGKNKFLMNELLIKAIVKNLKKSGQRANEPITLQNENEKVQAALQKADEKIGKALSGSNLHNSQNDFSRELEEIKKEDIRKVMTKELDDFDDDMTIGELKELERKGIRIMYPNLKYRKPKYKNVGDVLKYVESEGGNGDGVKLVIMNFND